MFRVLFTLILALSATANAADNAKPAIAFFLPQGTAKEDFRTKVWDALRAKLDRTGIYEVIDGPKMKDVADEAGEPINLDTSEAKVTELGKLVDAKVLVWGEIDTSAKGNRIRLKVLDLRD